jgi:hypothetical protein
MAYLMTNVISGYKMSNDGTLSASEKIQKEVVVAYLEVGYRNMLGRTEEGH